MIQLDDKMLRQLQLVHLEMLEEVDRICRKCGISYNLVGGTSLGAVRHGGPIPWDDDADVGFLRSEYEKFREACETELDKTRFYFQDYRNTPGYRWGYGKLRRKDTFFVRENQESMPYEQGVFIDIFPFDGVPDNYLLRTLHSARCFCYRKIFWSAIGRHDAKNAFARGIYSLMYKIPEKKLYASFDRFIKRSNRKQTQRVRILTFPTSTREYGYFRKWYTELTEISYDGLMLKIAADHDGYLKCKYGSDYMTLPPAEKRKCHPVSKIKLPDESEE